MCIVVHELQHLLRDSQMHLFFNEALDTLKCDAVNCFGSLSNLRKSVPNIGECASCHYSVKHSFHN